MNFVQARYYSALIATMAVVGFYPAGVSASDMVYFDQQLPKIKAPSLKAQQSDIVFFDVAPAGETVSNTGSIGDYTVSLTSDLFKSKIETATNEDIARIANDPKLFRKVTNGSQVQAIYLAEASKAPMPTKIGKVNLSKTMSIDHFDNIVNLPIKASSVAEGNAVVVGGILFFKESAIYHIDPANDVLNVSGISAQQSKRAHDYIRDLIAQFGYESISSYDQGFKSGIFLEPAHEYTKNLKDFMLSSPMYLTDASIPALMNGWDVVVQSGPGAGKDYDEVYLETLKWSNVDCINYLKKSNLGNIAIIDKKKYDVTKWPDEVLKAFVIRAKSVKDHELAYGFKGARRKSDGSRFGLGKVAYQNGLSDEQQIMNDQGRRVWDMRLVYDKDQFEAVAKAKVSTFTP
jgi:hypothetical protein